MRLRSPARSSPGQLALGERRERIATGLHQSIVALVLVAMWCPVSLLRLAGPVASEYRRVLFGVGMADRLRFNFSLGFRLADRRKEPS